MFQRRFSLKYILIFFLVTPLFIFSTLYFLYFVRGTPVNAASIHLGGGYSKRRLIRTLDCGGCVDDYTPSGGYLQSCSNAPDSWICRGISGHWLTAQRECDWMGREGWWCTTSDCSGHCNGDSCVHFTGPSGVNRHMCSKEFNRVSASFHYIPGSIVRVGTGQQASGSFRIDDGFQVRVQRSGGGTNSFAFLNSSEPGLCQNSRRYNPVDISYLFSGEGDYTLTFRELDVCGVNIEANVNLWIFISNPPNNLPNITNLTGPENCAEEGTFNIQARDTDPGDHVERVDLIINDGSDHLISFDLNSRTYNPANLPGNLTVTNVSIPSAASSVNVGITIDGFDSYGDHEHQNISYRARACDGDDCGDWTSTRNFYEEWYTNASISVSTDPSGTIISGRPVIFSWVGSQAASYQIRCSPALNPECPDSWRTVSASGSFSKALTSPGPNTTYTIYGRAYRGCWNDYATDGESIEVIVADPWTMTVHGDAYSFRGYKGQSNGLIMWDVDLPVVPSWAKGIPVGTDNKAYFSTYIISKEEQGNFPLDGRSSLYGYELGGYNDANRQRIATLGSVYDYLSGILEVNSESCVASGVSVRDNLDGSCIGNNIYLLENDVTLGPGWNQARNPNNVCVIISRSNVTVPDTVDQVDAFFLLDGIFTSASDTQPLVINGGVVAQDVNLQRDLVDDSVNPSELVNYDSKYFVGLRECIGEDYPFKVKEYGYAQPQED